MDLKKDRPGFRPIRYGRADGCNEGLFRSLSVIGGLRPRLSFLAHTRKSDIYRFFGVCDRVLRA
ncbi:MAG: hypothetical protein NT050_12580 [Verrucomicrobia bacterium]|nr:hypothetical protein [Verrucomicrobiota bacterium]